jgi:nucleoside-triphosphatase THEP1
LVYADLDLVPGPSGSRFVIRGIEKRNNYAIIDLTKTAELLPSDDDEDEKHGKYRVSRSK